jgi:hypothetical protein
MTVRTSMAEAQRILRRAEVEAEVASQLMAESAAKLTALDFDLTKDLDAQLVLLEKEAERALGVAMKAIEELGNAVSD